MTIFFAILGAIGIWLLIGFFSRAARRAVTATETTAQAMQAIYDAMPEEARMRSLAMQQQREANRRRQQCISAALLIGFCIILLIVYGR